MGNIRKRYSKSEKLEIVNESMEEHVDIFHLAERYSLHVNTIRRWRLELSKYDTSAFLGKGVEVLTEEQKEIRALKKQLKESELSNEILKKSSRHHSFTKQEKFAFMKKEANNYTVVMMSKVLGVSNSGYYKWLKNYNVRKSRYLKMDSQIRNSFKRNSSRYGSPRVALDLNNRGVNYSKTTIARRMKVLNLKARAKRKYVTTTNSEHGYKVAENLLNREFKVEKINTVWVSDITYVRVLNKWMYLTTFMDLADRMIVGWSLSKDMTTKNTVSKAFEKAVSNREIKNNSGLMIHSDRGVQYASEEFRNTIQKYGCIQSMSRKGNCWDNAVAESFFKTIKVESLNRYSFTNVETLYSILFRYIDGFYNTVRIHSSLGGMSPLQAYEIKRKKEAA